MDFGSIRAGSVDVQVTGATCCGLIILQMHTPLRFVLHSGIYKKKV